MALGVPFSARGIAKMYLYCSRGRQSLGSLRLGWRVSCVGVGVFNAGILRKEWVST